MLQVITKSKSRILSVLERTLFSSRIKVISYMYHQNQLSKLAPSSEVVQLIFWRLLGICRLKKLQVPMINSEKSF